MRFEIFRTDDVYAFQLLDGNEQPLLTSGTHPSMDACVDSVRDFAQTAANRRNYDMVGSNGETAFTVSADGRELARSTAYASAEDADQAADTLAETMTGTSDYKVAYTQTRTQAVNRPAFIVGLDSYDFTQVSQSGKMGFEPFQGKNNFHFFHFNDTNGKTLLFSQAYTSENTRDNGIRAVIRNSTREERYETQEGNGQVFFILKATNGREVARSTLFESRADMEKAMAFLSANATGFADEYRKPEKTSTRSGNPPVDKYDLNVASTSGQPGFDPFQNIDNKQHYFHFNNENAKPILFSQGYNNTASRDNGIRSVIKNAHLESRYLRRQEDGSHYFTLKAANNQEVAHSPFFGSAMEMEAAIDYLKGQAVTFAEKYRISIRSEESQTAQTQTFDIHVDRAAPRSIGPDEIPSIEPPHEMPPIEEPRIDPLPDAPKEIPPMTDPGTPREIPTPTQPETHPGIPPVTSKAKKPPVAMDVLNGAIPGRAGAVHIRTLAGKHTHGKIASYTIVSVPPVSTGTLLSNGQPVAAGQVLIGPEAGRLQFDPSGNASGETSFAYKVTDENGVESNVATFTIPVMKAPPTAKDVVFSRAKTDSGTVTISPLLATAKDGEIKKYIITALPPDNLGVLMLDGSQVQAQQELAPEAAKRLQFRAGKDASGNVMFKYRAVDSNNAQSNTASYTIKVQKAAAVAGAVATPARTTAAASRKPAAALSKPAAALSKPAAMAKKTVGKPVGKPMASPAAVARPLASKSRAGWLWVIPVALLAGAGIWYLSNRQLAAEAPAQAQANTAEPMPVSKPVAAPTIEDFQPIALYFDNDQPDPRAQTARTTLTYGQTYDTYYGLKKSFADEFGKGTDANGAGNATKQVGDFFDGKVKKGREDLAVLSAKLLDKLKAGNKVEITVTGFASPLAAGEYNKLLTARRVSSIENHFRAYNNGQFKEYMDSGMLAITEDASGEDAARQDISDDRTDPTRSLYSPAASAERRVEITNVTVAKPQ